METRSKKVLGIICGLSLLVLYAGSANAAFTCDASVSMPGMRPELTGTPSNVNDDYCVMIKCSNWSGSKRMFLHEGLAESGYATILTAISLGKDMRVTMESTAWHSLITDLEMLSTP